MLKMQEVELEHASHLFLTEKLLEEEIFINDQNFEIFAAVISNTEDSYYTKVDETTTFFLHRRTYPKG